jgi:hypothetical protein
MHQAGKLSIFDFKGWVAKFGPVFLDRHAQGDLNENKQDNPYKDTASGAGLKSPSPIPALGFFPALADGVFPFQRILHRFAPMEESVSSF